ncbi:transglutaminase-like cysteine peptidase [Rhabdaerophilum sp. SD176]|uniref:transglutaminase-like cysteine peptidase n=1 Tax=Rhabdaerophilum sp. SD176 TaxID=2983548 RepID=UPI0024E0042F|nr:transglutaminase-like cysteine peptidase [Rhabdaerophilum sp. SD176]
MKSVIVKTAGFIGLLMLANTGAQAQQTASIGAATSPPLGFVQFCRDYQEHCENRSFARTTIQLSEASWRTIVKINADVNREIIAVTDQDHWGTPEHWSFPEDGKGDCEDFVLEKRRRLVKAGFPIQTLLVTVVRDHKGDGHAVLTVKTDRGDFVLDNQVGKILAWKETGYRFIKRQADDNPARWVSLGGIDTSTVAASR